MKYSVMLSVLLITALSYYLYSVQKQYDDEFERELRALENLTKDNAQYNKLYRELEEQNGK